MQSFRYAWAGLRHFAANEHNGWIHAAATVLVVVAAVYFGLTPDEWRWIVLAIALVWLAEAFNTAIERLSDAVTIERNENIGYAKDVAAGAVLAAAVFATIIGLTIFLPHVVALVR
jgi:diacylglycerol kinase (ATP)